MRLRMTYSVFLCVILLPNVFSRPFRHKEDEDSDSEDDRSYLPESISKLVRSLYSSLIHTAVNSRHREELSISPAHGSTEFAYSKSLRSFRPRHHRRQTMMTHMQLPPPPRPIPMGPPRESISPVLMKMLTTILMRQQMPKPMMPPIITPPPVLMAPPPFSQHMAEMSFQKNMIMPGQQQFTPCSIVQAMSQTKQQMGTLESQSTNGRSVENTETVVKPVEQTRTDVQPQISVQQTTDSQTQPRTVQTVDDTQAVAAPTLEQLKQAIMEALPKATASASVTSLLSAIRAPRVEAPTIDVSSIVNVIKDQQNQLNELQDIQRAQHQQAEALAQAQIESQLQSMLQAQAQEAQSQTNSVLQAQAEAHALAEIFSKLPDTNQRTVNANPVNARERFVEPVTNPDSPVVQTTPNIVHLNPITVLDVNKLVNSFGGSKGTVCKTKECFRQITHFSGGHGHGMGHQLF